MKKVLLAFAFCSSVHIAAEPSKEGPTFKAIADLFAGAGAPESVPALLEKLPDASLLNDYVLMRKSRSNQTASPEAPRVILFGGGGNLILAYDATGKTVEAMEFDAKERRWNFFKVDFEKKPPKVAKNPQECRACHTNNKPNWERYPQWPGAYGEQDDKIDATPEEKKEFDDFVVKHGSDKDPYYGRLPKLTEHFELDNRGPNYRLGAALALRTAASLTSKIRENPNYETVKFAIAATTFRDCARASDGKIAMPFLPDGDFKAAAEKRASEMLAEGRWGSGRTEVPLYAFLAVMETLGTPIRVEDWAPVFQPKKKETSDPFAWDLHYDGYLLGMGLAPQDSELMKVVKPYLRPSYAENARFAKSQTEAELRNKALSLKLALPATAVVYDGGGKIRADACETLTKTSVAAMKNFQWTPPGRNPPVGDKKPSH